MKRTRRYNLILNDLKKPKFFPTDYPTNQISLIVNKRIFKELGNDVNEFKNVAVVPYKRRMDVRTPFTDRIDKIFIQAALTGYKLLGRVYKWK